MGGAAGLEGCCWCLPSPAPAAWCFLTEWPSDMSLPACPLLQLRARGRRRACVVRLLPQHPWPRVCHAGVTWWCSSAVTLGMSLSNAWRFCMWMHTGLPALLPTGGHLESLPCLPPWQGATLNAAQNGLGSAPVCAQWPPCLPGRRRIPDIPPPSPVCTATFDSRSWGLRCCACQLGFACQLHSPSPIPRAACLNTHSLVVSS